MNNTNFMYDDFTTGKNGISKKRILLIVVAIVVLVILGFIIYKAVENFKYRYELEIKYPTIIYTNETSNITIKLKGSEKYYNEIITSLMTNNGDILELENDEVYGEKGTLSVIPLAEGEESISIESMTGAEGKGKTLATKTINILVCPSFDKTILASSNIIVNKYEDYPIVLNVKNDKCKQNITFSSDNSSIIVVSKEGVITGVTSGKANLIISNKDKQFSIPVIVK